MKHARNLNLLFVIFLSVVILQFVSRYLSAPIPYFTSDDWDHFQRSSAPSTCMEVLKCSTREPDRPGQAIFLQLTFRLLGMHPMAHYLFSIVTYSFFLLLGTYLVFELSRNRTSTLLFGVCMALLPNLTESFHWSALITVSYMQIGYVACALFWVFYVRKERWFYLTLSIMCYAISLSSYECGFALPASLALLIPLSKWKSTICRMIPFASVFVLYMAWRLTHAFGMGNGILFPSRQIEFSFYQITHNAMAIVSWWIGSRMYNAILNGLNGFSTLALKMQATLVVINVISLAVVTRLNQHTTVKGKDLGGFPRIAILLFGLSWAVFGNITSLLSWTGGRLNFYPAIGISIIFATLPTVLPLHKLKPYFLSIALLCLVANQGTAKQWKDSGQFQYNLFSYLAATKEQWKNKECIVFDTRSLRQRQTSGLLSRTSLQPDTWAYYGNAGLIRGFVPSAMLKLITPNQQIPKVILDTECCAIIHDNYIDYTARYDPSHTFTTPSTNAFIIDCFMAGTRSKRTP